MEFCIVLQTPFLFGKLEFVGECRERIVCVPTLSDLVFYPVGDDALGIPHEGKRIIDLNITI